MTDLHPPPADVQLPTVAAVDDISEAEWDSLLRDFADANLYQTWAYGAERWGEKNLSHLVLRRGSTVVAAAQVRLARLPVVPAGIAYLRWGPMWQRRGERADPVVFRAMASALHREYVEARGLTLQVIPNAFSGTGAAEVMSEALNGLGARAVVGGRSYRTFVVDLTPPIEKLRSSLNQKWRNQLNASERKGLVLEVGSSGEAYRTFLDLYADMWARKQFDSSVDVHEFGRLQERLPQGAKMTIFTARSDGEPVGSLVCSGIGETALYVLGATNEKARELKAAYFLQWQAMKHFKNEGCAAYDLGGANPTTNPGGYHFKEGFGGPYLTQLPMHQSQGTWLSRALCAWAMRRGGGR